MSEHSEDSSLSPEVVRRSSIEENGILSAELKEEESVETSDVADLSALLPVPTDPPSFLGEPTNSDEFHLHTRFEEKTEEQK